MKKSPLPPHLKNVPKGYVYLGRGKEEVNLPEEWSYSYRSIISRSKYEFSDFGWSPATYEDIWNIVGSEKGWIESSKDMYYIAKRHSPLHKLQADYEPTESSANFIFVKDVVALKEENDRLKEEIKKWEEWAANMPKIKWKN